MTEKKKKQNDQSKPHEAVLSEFKKESAVIYVGPSIPKSGLEQYTVFANGLPQHVENLIVKCPSIRSLIVPVRELSEVRRNISQPGHAQSLLFKEINAFIRSEM